MSQLELWEDVSTSPPRRGAHPPTHARAPLRSCRECGRSLGRRWAEANLCAKCKDRPPRPTSGICCGRCAAGACEAIPF